MIISCNTWHYKAFEFSYMFSDKRVPKLTSLCAYWRRVFLGAPLIALGYLFGAAIMTAIYILITVSQAIFGRVPKHGFFGEWWKLVTLDDSDNFGLFRYKATHGLRLGDRSFYPYHVIVPMVIAWLLWVLGPALASGLTATATQLPSWFSAYPRIFFVGIGVVLLVFVIIRLVTADKPDDGFYLTKQFFKALKQKICPLVEFTDESSPATPAEEVHSS